jgi:hypothetical protein
MLLVDTQLATNGLASWRLLPTFETTQYQFLTRFNMKNETSKPTELGNNANLLLSAVSLAELVVKILDEKSHRGCDNKVWFGFQNGNGEEVGKDIERIIIKAKKFLANCR